MLTRSLQPLAWTALSLVIAAIVYAVLCRVVYPYDLHGLEGIILAKSWSLYGVWSGQGSTQGWFVLLGEGPLYSLLLSLFEPLQLGRITGRFLSIGVSVWGVWTLRGLNPEGSIWSDLWLGTASLALLWQMPWDVLSPGLVAACLVGYSLQTEQSRWFVLALLVDPWAWVATPLVLERAESRHVWWVGIASTAALLWVWWGSTMHPVGPLGEPALQLGSSLSWSGWGLYGLALTCWPHSGPEERVSMPAILGALVAWWAAWHGAPWSSCGVAAALGAAIGWTLLGAGGSFAVACMLLAALSGPGHSAAGWLVAALIASCAAWVIDQGVRRYGALVPISTVATAAWLTLQIAQNGPIPTAEDRIAGDRVVHALRLFPGEGVWMPSTPYIAVQAGHRAIGPGLAEQDAFEMYVGPGAGPPPEFVPAGDLRVPPGVFVPLAGPSETPTTVWSHSVDAGLVE